MTKIVLSFDDGRKDNLRVVRDICLKENIPATFNITTDYVSEQLLDDEKPCNNVPMDKESLCNIANNSFIEIAGHGKKHSNECENLINGVNELREWLPNRTINGIASPYSQAIVSELVRDKDVYCKNGISYIRLGDRITSFCYVKKVLRKLNRMFFHLPFIFSWVHEQTFVSKNDDFILYSVPILKRDTVDEVIALVKNAVKKDKSVILMFHSVLHKGEPEYESNWTWDWDKFENLVLKLKQMQESDLLKITTTQDLMFGK